jgi:glycosyltransferase involved in cell wall biosynthesis
MSFAIRSRFLRSRRVPAPAVLSPQAAADEARPPLLSICVPTYHRPGLLARALQSIGPLPPGVEVIVSDNSTANDDCEQVARTVLAAQPPSQWRYYRNPPGGNVTSNWNLCLSRAQGHFVQMLHDDDYLRPGALTAMLAALRTVRGQHEVVQFGVDVVGIDEQVLKPQRPRQLRYLAPADALEKLLTDSSYIRMPALVASRAAYAAVGGPDPTQENTDDTDIWARLFSRFGLYQVPACVACYTVHPGALTSGMFNEHIIELLLRIFQKADQTHLLPEERLRQAKAHFFHQFILAGTYRSIRRRDFSTARKVLRLAKLPALRQLHVPFLLLPVRLLFDLLLFSLVDA